MYGQVVPAEQSSSQTVTDSQASAKPSAQPPSLPAAELPGVTSAATASDAILAQQMAEAEAKKQAATHVASPSATASTSDVPAAQVAIAHADVVNAPSQPANIADGTITNPAPTRVVACTASSTPTLSGTATGTFRKHGTRWTMEQIDRQGDFSVTKNSA